MYSAALLLSGECVRMLHGWFLDVPVELCSGTQMLSQKFILHTGISMRDPGFILLCFAFLEILTLPSIGRHEQSWFDLQGVFKVHSST